MVIPIAVLTMIWMFRMAANLRKLGRTGQTWAPGWGIGAWFVPPCVVYAVPWLMFKELWKGSDPTIAPGDPAWKQAPVSPLVTVWWVLYGLVPLLGVLLGRGHRRATARRDDHARRSPSDSSDFSAVNIFFAVVGMVATFVYLRLVRDLSARHMQSTREA